MAASGPKSLKEYLRKYESTTNEEEKKRKKKKKKPDSNRGTGVLVVDEDPVWQKPVILEEEDNDSADEERPLVDEDVEVRRMKRLEQLRLRRPYNAIAEDGSGWVSLGPGRSDFNQPNSDMSPPRKRRAQNDTPSPEPETKPPGSVRESADLSPPRLRRNRQDTPSPSNSNLSPPRRHRAQNDVPSPAIEDNDLSPPRQRQRRRRYQLPSPEPDRKPGHSTGLDSDLSPPWKRRARNDLPSPELELKPAREDTDLSPPRQRGKHHHTPSPGPDISVSRRANRVSSNRDDMRVSELDLSPPRKNKKDADLSLPRRTRKEELSVSAPSKALPRTGLISGNDIREEISKTKNEDLLRFQGMDPSITGRGAEAVYRDKMKGERVSKDDYLKSKQKGQEKPKEIKLEWGKGLAQKREAEARVQELELEKDKPFARNRDDPELDKMMKDRLRWGDPMAHLVKKKYSDPVLLDLGENEKMKESGFIIPQDIPSHSWIKRGLDAAPNRYGIRPGRHWDGVDRSTVCDDSACGCPVYQDVDMNSNCSKGRMRNALQRKKLTCGRYQICNLKFAILVDMRYPITLAPSGTWKYVTVENGACLSFMLNISCMYCWWPSQTATVFQV
ncbi:hypothetical protein Patl1_01194 [Pistacia atlantica]|uniref:Uncharacterized protein n=1 Tax=Pistacia atlantica TaxID=434234 RepID=A0ACC1CC10_9ROSI|nr:hypothetical protein Patl1_01194 [Pistacia atlantica]